MNHREFITSGCAGTIGLSGLLRAQTPQARKKPNIVSILTDDLGIGDAGCYGAGKEARQGQETI